jgi:ribonuclease HII
MLEGDKYKYLIGIDEVGRGPIAGPTAVGAVLYELQKKDKIEEIFNLIKDSKKLTEKKREEFFQKIKYASDEKLLKYSVSFVSNKQIDKFGIVPAIKACLEKSINKVMDETYEDRPRTYSECLVLLDGGLKAPEEFIHQKTIIGGDNLEMIISMASVAAKVRRDRVMCLLAKKFPDYGFEKHKGYGTKLHYGQIKKYGLCEIHRRTYCKSVNF